MLWDGGYGKTLQPDAHLAIWPEPTARRAGLHAGFHASCKVDNLRVPFNGIDVVYRGVDREGNRLRRALEGIGCCRRIMFLRSLPIAASVSSRLWVAPLLATDRRKLRARLIVWPRVVFGTALTGPANARKRLERHPRRTLGRWAHCHHHRVLHSARGGAAVALLQKGCPALSYSDCDLVHELWW